MVRFVGVCTVMIQYDWSACLSEEICDWNLTEKQWQKLRYCAVSLSLSLSWSDYKSCIAAHCIYTKLRDLKALSDIPVILIIEVCFCWWYSTAHNDNCTVKMEWFCLCVIWMLSFCKAWLYCPLVYLYFASLFVSLSCLCPCFLHLHLTLC